MRRRFTRVPVLLAVMAILAMPSRGLMQRRPRPRNPLLEGGPCLHTALQPPATRPG